MLKVTIVGVDLAKSVFQLHGATSDGTYVFRKKLNPNRGQSPTQFGRIAVEHAEVIFRTAYDLMATLRDRCGMKYSQLLIIANEKI